MSAQRFSSLPGPLSLPLIGTLWNYLPIIGKYRFDRLHLNGLLKYDQFGEVVKEEIVPKVNVVWIYTPDDVKELFKKEGKYPERRSHLALQKYRLDRPEIYNTGGLLPTNGAEWWKLRSVFQKGLSSPQHIKQYLPVANEVLDEFMVQIRKERTDDFLPMLSKLFLELICLVAFDVKLNSFNALENSPNSRTNRLIDAALTTNSCILRTDNGPQLWKYFDTPLYRKLSASHKYMEDIAVELVNLRKNKTVDTNSLLSTYLQSDAIDLKDVVGISVDMILAGIDTTTYTSSFILYHLANNKTVQEKLYLEACELLPTKETEVTSNVLANASYLKAVVKETHRLNPISVGIGRVLAQDAVFSGYDVPQGTVVVTQNQVVCRMEKYFLNAGEFLPERWIKSDSNYKPVNPYLVLPFGHGPRTCIARRLAEQNMQALIIKLCRSYEVIWLGSKLDSKSLLINKPDGPVKLGFIPRK